MMGTTLAVELHAGDGKQEVSVLLPHHTNTPFVEKVAIYSENILVIIKILDLTEH